MLDFPRELLRMTEIKQFGFLSTVVNVCKNQQFKINVQLLYKYTFFLLLSWIRTLVAVVIVGPGVVVVAKNTVILIKMFVSELSQGKPDVTYPDVHFLPTVSNICAFFFQKISSKLVNTAPQRKKVTYLPLFR